jgi:hypothetical protein
MTAQKQLLNFENVVKLSTLIVVVLTNYYATKSDIRDLTTEKRFEITHIQYQLDELKDCCNERQPKQIVFNQPKAILPNGINLENEQ